MAQVVFERQIDGSVESGPCEFVKVGVRFDARVIWLESAFFPGDNGEKYNAGVDLGRKIVHAVNHHEELLAALKELLVQVEGCAANHYGENPEGGSFPHIEHAQAIVARAEGRAP